MRSIKKCLFFIFWLYLQTTSAQNKVVIKGNVDTIPDVNISIYNSKYGTTTDHNGNYAINILFSKSKNIYLKFSKIGFSDTLVKLSYRDQDTIFLNVHLKRISYNLDEISVLSYRYFYRSINNSSIKDLDFTLAGQIVLLEQKRNYSKIIIIDTNNTLLSSRKLNKKFNNIFFDCFGNIELIGNNYCMQIYYNEKRVNIIDVFLKDKFQEKLKPCLFQYGKAYVFKSDYLRKGETYLNTYHNKKVTYYYVEIDSSKVYRKVIVSFFDTKAFQNASEVYCNILSIYNQITPDIKNVIKNNTWDRDMKKLLTQVDDVKYIHLQNKLFNLISWYLKIESKPIFVKAFKANNELILINLSNNTLLKYNKDFVLTDSVDLMIDGHEYNGILQDRNNEKIYLMYEKNGINYLEKINLKTGQLDSPVKACTKPFPDIFRIYDNYSYCVYYNKQQHFSYILRKSIKK